MNGKGTLKRKSHEKEVQCKRQELDRLEDIADESNVQIREAFDQECTLTLDIFIRSEGLKHIALQIIKLLDLHSLSQLFLASKEWNEIIKNSKHWWYLQLVDIKHFKLFGHLIEPRIFDGFFDDPNSDNEELPTVNKTLEILHPKLTNAFDIICEKETFSNIEIFTLFMRDFIHFAINLKDEDQIARYDHTPLNFALRQNRLDIFNILAKIPEIIQNEEVKSLSMNYLHHEHKNLIGMAVRRKNLNFVEFFASFNGQNGIDFSAVNEYGGNLFHNACATGSPEIVKFFLNSAENLNIDLNACNENSFTPLMYSLWSRDITKLLLEDNRIDVNIRDESGNTALHQICKTKYSGSMKSYDDAYQYNDPQGGSVDSFKFLSKYPKFDFTIANYEGETLLHLNCDLNCPLKVEALLEMVTEKGINVNARDNAGQTPLHIAFGRIPKSQCLCENSFELATFFPVIEVIFKFSTRLDFDFNATDDGGNTPMHLMHHHTHHEIVVKFLSEAKKKYNIEFDLNITNNEGLKPPNVKSAGVIIYKGKIKP